MNKYNIKPLLHIIKDKDNFTLGIGFIKENHHKYWVRKGKCIDIYFAIIIGYFGFNIGFKIRNKFDEVVK